MASPLRRAVFAVALLLPFSLVAQGSSNGRQLTFPVTPIETAFQFERFRAVGPALTLPLTAPDGS